MAKPRQISIRLGTIIDKAPLWTLAVAYAASVVSFGVLYYLMSGPADGIASTASGMPRSVSFGDALHFSTVTISSLGYGDYRPIGLCRVFAGVEVTVGLVLFSLFVGKLASERSSRLTRLIYTSDHERRLQASLRDIRRRKHLLHHALRDRDGDRIIRRTNKTRALVEGLKSYLVFQFQVGSLGEANVGILRRVLRASQLLHELTILGARTPGLTPATRESLARTVRSLGHLATAVREICTDTEVAGVCAHMQARTSHYAAKPNAVAKRQVPADLKRTADRVRACLPAQPWPRDIHKSVAAKLGISNNLAQLCIVEIAGDAAKSSKGASEETGGADNTSTS